MKLKEIQLTEKDEARFWTRVDKKSEDECWPWIGESKSGYGIFEVYRNGKTIRYRANRVSLYIKTRDQQEIARHTCDNPICCNPKHLLWGTQKDNVQDMISRNRQAKLPLIVPRGTSNGMSKLQESDALRIRQEFAEGKKCKKELALEYNVSLPNIHAIIIRRTWSHI